MYCTLIICTFKRAGSLSNLLHSIAQQTLYPDEILVVDGSPDDETEKMIRANDFKNLTYFSVPPHLRGLTRQRNFGIDNISAKAQIVAFLDDDTVLMPDYFEQMNRTFEMHPDVSGVGGIALNENAWEEAPEGKIYNSKKFYCFDGHVYKESQRNVVRNYLGLASNLGPGKMPLFSHGRTCGFPITGRVYDADLLIGMSFAFRSEVVRAIRFSPYFEGYGLYEDADFSIRALRFGRNVIDTRLQLRHFHHPSGRPNHYRYGRMVVRNGYYVWRVRNPKPSFKARIKWHLITLLLAAIRLSNVLSGPEREAALKESAGRFAAWIQLTYNRPQRND
ncbi:glycosyl transferase family 2 [Flavobacterium magnum]|uniref:Glycosyl transferase family 2 n=2 Tax=Flavobacterium magnum TaxID=2162713 RepID=A0A2S0RE37_9FLAO|nr:glycosyl transferase family 2 [Flavobacterium magnum]